MTYEELTKELNATPNLPWSPPPDEEQIKEWERKMEKLAEGFKALGYKLIYHEEYGWVLYNKDEVR